jgi:hypothetical protein
VDTAHQRYLWHGCERTGPLRELHGVVERITFQNAENGFTVACLAPSVRRPRLRPLGARIGSLPWSGRWLI